MHAIRGGEERRNKTLAGGRCTRIRACFPRSALFVEAGALLISLVKHQRKVQVLVPPAEVRHQVGCVAGARDAEAAVQAARLFCVAFVKVGPHGAVTAAKLRLLPRHVLRAGPHPVSSWTRVGAVPSCPPRLPLGPLLSWTPSKLKLHPPRPRLLRTPSCTISFWGLL